MVTGEFPLPNFLIIGAERCGTRWLRANLEEHPEVFTPSASVSYFNSLDRMRRRGIRGYRQQFGGWSGEPIVGESSPKYLLPGNDPREVARRIDANLPDVKLIAIVREPVERMYSAVLHHIKRGRLPIDADLFAMVAHSHPDVDELDLVGAGRYTANLYPYHAIFGDRLLVLLNDDLRSRPAEVYDAALRHIGARPGFEASRLDRVLFSNRRSVRPTGPRLSRQQRRILYMLYRSDVEELEALIGCDLTAWDPGPPPFGWEAEVPGIAETVYAETRSD